MDHVGEPGAPLAHPDHALQVKWGVFKGNNFGHISTLKILANRACIDTTVCDQKCQMPKRLDAVIHVYSVVALEVMGKGCHLQETCNKVDCFIVVSGALEYGLDVEKLKVYQRRLLGREGLRVTPNLYYKLVEKDLIPVYISSAPTPTACTSVTTCPTILISLITALLFLCCMVYRVSEWMSSLLVRRSATRRS